MAKPPDRLTSRYPNLLVRPCGLAGTRLDGRVAWVCCAVLVAIQLFELVTPNDVVASLALIPLLAAMWTLSGRMALRVALVAAVVFGVIVAIESANRPTVVFIMAVALVLAATVRFYAAGLAVLLPASRLRILNLQLPNGLESLTSRELEVATLASRGYSAAEIGVRLHISDRTVESHLANSYAKLAIHSRSGLREIGAIANQR